LGFVLESSFVVKSGVLLLVIDSLIHLSFVIF